MGFLCNDKIGLGLSVSYRKERIKFVQKFENFADNKRKKDCTFRKA